MSTVSPFVFYDCQSLNNERLILEEEWWRRFRKLMASGKGITCSTGTATNSELAREHQQMQCDLTLNSVLFESTTTPAPS
jgi:hypothetical protein